MTWKAIIAMIMAAVGPLLGDLLKKWLEALLNKMAKGVLAPAGRDRSGNAGVLFEEALAKTPRAAVA